MADRQSQASSAEPSQALHAAARQRVALQTAASRVEAANASAAAGPGWRSELATRLHELRTALEHHVAEVEAHDGLLAELAARAPRLSRQIEDTRAEHPTLQDQVRRAITAAAGDRPSDELRSDVVDLLAAVARHRQRGADLVYEGYEVDLGGG